MIAILGIHHKWDSLLPLLVINALMLMTVLYFAFTFRRRPRDLDLISRAHSRWLGPFFFEYWGWLIHPLENFFIYLKLKPNFFTTMGFILSVGCGVAFATGHFGLAGWLMIVGGTCDMFDGRIARRTQQTSKSGAFYDSVMDRFSEAVVFVGLAYYYQNSWVLYIVLMALIGSMMVSYARAKGDSMGVDCQVGTMQRPERIVYMGVASIFSPPFRQVVFPNVQPPVEYLTIAALILIGVMTLVTAVYRMIYITYKIHLAEGQGRLEPKSRFMKKLVSRYLDI